MEKKEERADLAERIDSEEFYEEVSSLIYELMELCHRTAKEKGWWDKDRTFGDTIALCHSELSEALEDYRNGLNPSTIYYKDKPYGIAIELADLLIRVFDLAYAHDIPLHLALIEKMSYNLTRPYRHGDKKL